MPRTRHSLANRAEDPRIVDHDAGVLGLDQEVIGYLANTDVPGALEGVDR